MLSPFFNCSSPFGVIYIIIGIGAIICKYANCITLTPTCIVNINIVYKTAIPNAKAKNPPASKSTIYSSELSCSFKQIAAGEFLYPDKAPLFCAIFLLICYIQNYHHH